MHMYIHIGFNYFSERPDLFGRPAGRCSLAPISSRTQARVLSPFFSARKESESGCLPLFLLPPSLPPSGLMLTYSFLSASLRVSQAQKQCSPLRIPYFFSSSFPETSRERLRDGGNSLSQLTLALASQAPNRPPLRPHQGQSEGGTPPKSPKSRKEQQ